MSIASPSFDSNDVATWGLADPQRLVFGLVVHDRRLYYSVNAGPEVWSVGLGADGSILGDARVEIAVSEAEGQWITDLAFNQAGVMHLALRGPPQADVGYRTFVDPASSGRILRFAPSTTHTDAAPWTPVPESTDAGWRGNGSLSFGPTYDGNHRVQPTCGSTLWVSGEADETTASNEVVRGIRGSGAEANAPRLADYDGRTDDRGKSGQIGSVRVWQRCPERGPRQTLPPLVLEKQCEPCAVGAVCSCSISVRNTSSAALSGTIDIDDVNRVLSGRRVGERISVVAVAPDAPDFRCMPLADELSCRIDQLTLKPGASRSITVDIATADLVADNSFGVQNCATLHAGSNWPEQTVCRELGADILVEKRSTGACVPGQPCTFDVILRNLAATPFSGQLALTDAVVVNASVAGGTIKIKPPFGCTPEPTELPFACTASVSLQPGEERRHRVVVVLPNTPGAELRDAVNCAVVTDPAVDAFRLLPGLPPNPLQGPGFSCVRFGPDDVAAAGGGQGGGNAGKGGGGSGGGKPGGGGGSSACDKPRHLCCPKGSVWNGLRCLVQPQSGGGGSGGGPAPPCPQAGLVRNAAGTCDCPPFLERHADASGKILCCLTPCGAGMKRVNAQCVPDCESQGLVLSGQQCVCGPDSESKTAICSRPPAPPVPAPATPQVAPAPPPAVTPQPPLVCAKDMENINGRCFCRAGLTWRDGECRRQQRTCPDGKVVPVGENCPEVDRRKRCPDGSRVRFDEPCPRTASPPQPPPPPPPPPKRCRDGRVVPHGTQCPPIREPAPPDDRDTGRPDPPKVCPDGRRVSRYAQCLRTCPDGSRVAMNRPCPPPPQPPPRDPGVSCPDGTRAPSYRQCSRICPNGSRVPIYRRCPTGPQPPPPDVGVKCPDGSRAPSYRLCRKVCPDGRRVPMYQRCATPPPDRQETGVRCPDGQRASSYRLCRKLCPNGMRVPMYRPCRPPTGPTPQGPPTLNTRKVCPDGRVVRHFWQCRRRPPGTPPPQQNCRQERVCAQWGKAAPGQFAGPCLRWTMQTVCGSNKVN
jgi:hypothetical protein